jgi:cell division protein FtsI (penicillin-binding protein 3)
MSDFAAPHFRQAQDRGRSAPRGGATTRPRDDWRLIVVILTLFLVYATVGIRMGLMALNEPVEPQLSRGSGVGATVRGEITDRNGNLLAANLPAFSLYANPREIKYPAAVARDLAKIFPDMTAEGLGKRLATASSFVWVKRPITPRQKQAVLDLGYPGLKFGSRTMRVYPAGRAAAHIVGGVRAENEDVRYAELVGSGGAEGFFDERLRDPARVGTPLALSIDLTVQSALREVLAAGVKKLSAIGGVGVLMDVRTGELLALVSLPDFDPNQSPARFTGPAELSPRFNRAAQGRYELGSMFKVLTAALALDTAVAKADTMIETVGPILFGRQKIRDLHKLPPQMTLTDIIVRSSNVGAARLALRVGTPRMKDYFKRLGLFEPTSLELSEARRAKPLLPPKWTDLSTMTISFGHGISVSPVHLAAAYATLANGGRRTRPTLIKGGAEPGERVFSTETALTMMQVIREVVSRGTGRRTDLPGYEVGGKTGTADKYRPGGGYYKDKVISSFASVFPTSDPKYVLLISLDEPVDRSSRYISREASRTAVPVTAAAIQRIAPLLGLRPLPVSKPAGIAAIATAGQ